MIQNIEVGTRLVVVKLQAKLGLMKCKGFRCIVDPNLIKSKCICVGKISMMRIHFSDYIHYSSVLYSTWKTY